MTYTVMYFPKDKPIPEGWSFRSYLQGTHGFYSILIIKNDSAGLVPSPPLERANPSPPSEPQTQSSGLPCSLHEQQSPV